MFTATGGSPVAVISFQRRIYRARGGYIVPEKPMVLHRDIYVMAGILIVTVGVTVRGAVCDGRSD